MPFTLSNLVVAFVAMTRDNPIMQTGCLLVLLGLVVCLGLAINVLLLDRDLRTIARYKARQKLMREAHQAQGKQERLSVEQQQAINARAPQDLRETTGFDA